MRKICFTIIMTASLFLFSSQSQGNLQYLGDNFNRVKNPGNIVFSEVLYDSWVYNETEGEWLELYNPTGSSMNIGGWTINDNTHTYTIPNGTGVGAYCYFVISAGSSAFSSRYGFPPGLSNFSLELNNSGDYLILKNSSGTVIDQVAWKSGGSSIPGWGSSSEPHADEGRSIMRSNVNQDTDTHSDWQSNQVPDPRNDSTPSPQIHLDKTSMTFSLAEGNDSASDSFTISNSGTGSLNWTVSKNLGWLTVDPTWGQDTGTVTVTVSSSGLTSGSYSDVITVTDANASNSPQIVNVSLTVTGSSGDAVLHLNRDNLYFGSKGGIVTGAQTFMITNQGEGNMDWTISKNSWQLDVSPDSGSNEGIITVTVDPADLKPGVYYGTLTINSPDAVNSPKTIQVFLSVYSSTSIPFGEFATPAAGSLLSSSIPVTGWVLDDIDVINVKIYSGADYIGDAIFVDGARPDVEQAFPGYPKNYQAGWGYMMLSNFLPGGGNGIYTITAKATDAEGNVVTLGSKTITVDNANAVKPFGALDTPAQGGTASGSDFINWGWVLTPQPNFIPNDGSKINVYVDGVNLGNPTYNIYRPDIAALFPGYANGDHAGGYFTIDTTGHSSGIHTISWTAADSAGNTDGIGSRYFTIINSSPSNSTSRGVISGCDIAKIPLDYSPILIRSDYRSDYHAAEMNDTGDCKIIIKELEGIEILLTGYSPNTGNTNLHCDGYLLVGNRLKALPIGSTLDRTRGIFYWMPGIGYYGEYRFVFAAESPRGRIKKYLTIDIIPKKD